MRDRPRAKFFVDFAVWRGCTVCLYRYLNADRFDIYGLFVTFVEAGETDKCTLNSQWISVDYCMSLTPCAMLYTHLTEKSLNF